VMEAALALLGREGPPPVLADYDAFSIDFG